MENQRKVERARKLLAEQRRAKTKGQTFKIQYKQLLCDPVFKTFRDSRSLKTFFNNVRRNVEDEERRAEALKKKKKAEAETKLLNSQQKQQHQTPQQAVSTPENLLKIEELLQKANKENEKLKTTVADLEGKIQFTEWEMTQMKQLVRTAYEEKDFLQEEVEEERRKIDFVRKVAQDAEYERERAQQDHQRLRDERDRLLREQERAWYIEKDRNLLMQQVDYWKDEHYRLRKVADSYVSQNFEHISRAEYEDVRKNLADALMFKKSFQLATVVESKVRSTAMLYGKPSRGKSVREWKMPQMRGILYGGVSSLRRLGYQIGIDARDLTSLIENWLSERCKLSHEVGYAEKVMDHDLFHKMSYDITKYLYELEKKARYVSYYSNELKRQ